MEDARQGTKIMSKLEIQESVERVEAFKLNLEIEATSREKITKLGDSLHDDGKTASHLGKEAVYYYLIQKHNWLPDQVRSLSTEDLFFVLDSEFKEQ